MFGERPYGHRCALAEMKLVRTWFTRWNSQGGYIPTRKSGYCDGLAHRLSFQRLLFGAGPQSEESMSLSVGKCGLNRLEVKRFLCSIGRKRSCVQESRGTRSEMMRVCLRVLALMTLGLLLVDLTMVFVSARSESRAPAQDRSVGKIRR